MQLSAVASLAVASRQKEVSEGKNEVQDFKEIVEVVSKAARKNLLTNRGAREYFGLMTDRITISMKERLLKQSD